MDTEPKNPDELNAEGFHKEAFTYLKEYMCSIGKADEEHRKSTFDQARKDLGLMFGLKGDFPRKGTKTFIGRCIMLNRTGKMSEG